MYRTPEDQSPMEAYILKPSLHLASEIATCGNSEFDVRCAWKNNFTMDSMVSQLRQ
jgi:hypothetical protein